MESQLLRVRFSFVQCSYSYLPVYCCKGNIWVGLYLFRRPLVVGSSALRNLTWLHGPGANVRLFSSSFQRRKLNRVRSCDPPNWNGYLYVSRSDSSQPPDARQTRPWQIPDLVPCGLRFWYWLPWPSSRSWTLTIERSNLGLPLRHRHRNDIPHDRKQGVSAFTV
jgi:hypothetical protein